MTAGSNAMLRTYAQDGQYASTIRPTGLAAASAASAQCTPQSTGMSPRSAKATSSARPQASHRRVVTQSSWSVRSRTGQLGDDRGGGGEVAAELDVVQTVLLAALLQGLHAGAHAAVQHRRGGGQQA